MYNYKTKSAVRICLIIALALTAGARIFADDATSPAQDNQGDKVYKKVGPDGEVIYSDKPSTGSKEIKVPTGSEYQPVKPPANFTPYQPPVEPKPAAINNSVTITSPKNDSATWETSGEVLVTVSLASPLTAGQQLEYLMDGKVEYTGTETSYTLSNVFRGTHVLTVRIKEQDGRTIVSPAVTFTLHRPSLQKPSHP